MQEMYVFISIHFGGNYVDLGSFNLVSETSKQLFHCYTLPVTKVIMSSTFMGKISMVIISS